ncbi:hypothetical protein [Armatimonas rosea]
MDTLGYLTTLKNQGIVLWREGDCVRFRAPAGTLTAPIRATITAARSEILHVLPDTPDQPDLVVEVPIAEIERDIALAARTRQGLLPPLYCSEDKRQVLLDWVTTMIHLGGLPLLTDSETIHLPSGGVVGVDLIEWWTATYRRCCRLQAQPFPDCQSAAVLLRNDLKSLAVLFADQWHRSHSSGQ